MEVARCKGAKEERRLMSRRGGVSRGKVARHRSWQARKLEGDFTSTAIGCAYFWFVDIQIPHRLLGLKWRSVHSRVQRLYSQTTAMGDDEMAAIRAAKVQLRKSIGVSLQALQPAEISKQCLSDAKITAASGLLMLRSIQGSRHAVLHA